MQYRINDNYVTNASAFCDANDRIMRYGHVGVALTRCDFQDLFIREVEEGKRAGCCLEPVYHCLRVAHLNVHALDACSFYSRDESFSHKY